MTDLHLLTIHLPQDSQVAAYVIEAVAKALTPLGYSSWITGNDSGDAVVMIRKDAP